MFHVWLQNKNADEKNLCWSFMQNSWGDDTPSKMCNLLIQKEKKGTEEEWLGRRGEGKIEV